MKLDKNKTKYNSEDLQRLLDHFEAPIYGSDLVSFRYLVKTNNEKYPNVEGYEDLATSSWTGSILVLSPAAAAKKLGLLALASPGHAPEKLVEALVKALQYRSGCKDIPSANVVKIRIDNRNPKGQAVAKPKPTEAEKIGRMKRMYGVGRVLPGGRKKQSYLWRHKVAEAESYYEIERKARSTWREKLRAQGVELRPDEIHETFPEFLRRMASEFENKA